MDKVLIEDLHVRGILGVNDSERNTPRDILINVTLFTETRPATRSDTLDGCVDYSLVTEDIRTLVESAQRFTVEALAEDIADLCLRRKELLKVVVKVEKPGALEHVRSVGVEIERKR
jgi:FolB domain-containing protein